MAISDTLAEAADDIRKYLERRPAAYASVRPEIDRLLKNMDGLRARLDTPWDRTPRN